MNKNKKGLAVLSSAALGVLIASAVSTSAHAAVTDYVAKNATNNVINFNLNNLLADYTNKLSGQPSPMFDEYLKDASKLVAFKDSIKGYVSYDSVMKAYTDAVVKDGGKTFVMNTVTENAAAADIANVTVDSTCGTDGKITTVTTPNLAVSSVSAITTTGFIINFTPTSDLTIAGLPTTVTLTPTTGTAVTGTITYNNTAKTATVTAALTAGTTYTASVAGLNLGTSNTITVPGQLAVSSVSAINLKQVQVVFSNSVDKTTAETVGNYTVSPQDYILAGTGGSLTTVTNASLQADNKTVILTLTGSYANQKSNQSIAIQNVKDVNGNVLASTYNKADIGYNDITAPTITAINAVGPRTIEINFSEPVTKGTIGTGIDTNITAANFTVDNGSMSVVSATADYTKNKVTLVVAADLAAGNHTAVVNSAADNTFTDFAGLPVIKTTQTFTASTVTTAPTVSVKSSTPNKVTLQFSTPVKNVGSATFYHDYSNLISSGVATINTTGNQDGTYSDLWDVPFATNLITGTSNLNITNLLGTEIQDRFGNKMANTNATFTVTADTTLPIVTSVTASTRKTIKVKFSKDMNPTDAVNKSYYVFKNSTGTVLNGSTVTDLDSYGCPGANVALSYDAVSYTTTMTFTNAVPATAYQLTTKDIKDSLTYTTNKLAENTQNFTVADTSPVTMTNATKSGSKLIVTYSKPIATSGVGSALDVNNYKINWNNDATVALPTGSTAVVGASSNIVVITLSDASKLTGATKIAANVVDATGASIDGFNNTKTVVNDASIASVTDITNVKLLGKGSFSFEVNQPLSAVYASRIKVGTNAVDQATFVNGILADGTTYGSVVTCTITNTSNYLDTLVTTNKLSIAGSAKDLNFVAQAFTNLQTTPSTLATANTALVKDYSGSYIKSITTAIAGATLGQIDTLTVKFSEPVLPGSVSLDSFTVAGYTITNVAPTSISSGAADTFAITVTKKSTPDTGAIPVTKLVKPVTDASVQANLEAAQTDAQIVTVTDGVSPSVSGISFVNKTGGTASTLEAGDQIAITYSEPVTVAGLTAGGAAIASSTTLGDITTAGAITGIGTFGTPGGITIATTLNTVALSADSKIVTITLGTLGGTTVVPSGTFTPAAGVVDKATSPNSVDTSAEAVTITGAF